MKPIIVHPNYGHDNTCEMYKFGHCTDVCSTIQHSFRKTALDNKIFSTMNFVPKWCFEHTLNIQITILTLAALNFVFGVAKVATQGGVKSRLDIWLIIVVSYDLRVSNRSSMADLRLSVSSPSSHLPTKSLASEHIVSKNGRAPKQI